jgi:hypothetical protein
MDKKRYPGASFAGSGIFYFGAQEIQNPIHTVQHGETDTPTAGFLGKAALGLSHKE